MLDFEGKRPTNRHPRREAKNSARRKPYRVNVLQDAPGGTRTPNRLIRSQVLYPIELRARDEPAYKLIRRQSFCRLLSCFPYHALVARHQ